jgi:hypothetical protein
VDAQYEGAIPHRTYFAVTSLGFIVVLLAMTVVVFLGRPDDEVLLMQLARLADHSTLYQVGYVLATLLPVFGLLLTGGVGLLLRPQYWGGETRGTRIMGVLGSLFVLACVPVSGYAYVTQWTVFPRELGKNWQDAERWYISVSGTTPQSMELLGWGLFGIGAVLIGGRLLRERPPLNWSAWVLVASGLAGVAAWLLDAAGVDAATTFSLISMALTVPFALGIFLVSQQEAEPVGSGSADATIAPATTGEAAGSGAGAGNDAEGDEA